jgi:hypothetical protein
VVLGEVVLGEVSGEVSWGRGGAGRRAIEPAGYLWLGLGAGPRAALLKLLQAAIGYAQLAFVRKTTVTW